MAELPLRPDEKYNAAGRSSGFDLRRDITVLRAALEAAKFGAMQPRDSLLLLTLFAAVAAGCAPVSVEGLGPGPALERSGVPDWLPPAPPLPADSELLDELRVAVDFRARDDFDRFLDARDPGELLEHATITQTALDRGIFGLDDLFVIGDELFDYEFRPEQGLGNGLAGRVGVRAGPNLAPNVRRVHEGEFGGPDSHNCASCHSKGGLDGAGQSTQNAFLRGDGRSTRGADERNPPHLLGLGPIAALAREMSRDLAGQREAAVTAARSKGADVEVALKSKGVSFGALVARADGSVDSSRIEGVDAGLVVKPFGWKGHRATLEEIVEESLRIHMGLLSAREQVRARGGGIETAVYGDGPWYDVDRDGVHNEVEAGMVTSLAAYLAQLEAPVVRPPEGEALLDRFARGQRLFDDLGCASCHRPVLVLEDAVLEVRPLDPEHASKPAVKVNVAADGDQPKIEPQKLYGTTYNVRLFSDLKRHDMGPELAGPAAQGGIAPAVFLTRPLWGLAFTAPYLHDGRAPTIHDAVRLHGGEAAPVREKYLALPDDGRAAVSVYLLSLDREPKLFVP
jgi:mono/diheme cytochrome c family protein